MTSRLPNGRRLLALRELLGLTQQDLAHTLGISQPTLSKIEKAERPLSTGLIDRARHHYDLPSQFFHIPPGILDIGIPVLDPDLPEIQHRPGRGGTSDPAHLPGSRPRMGRCLRGLRLPHQPDLPDPDGLRRRYSS